jgi:prophage regulatory protein
MPQHHRPARMVLHPEVQRRSGLSPSQIRRLEARGDFPARIQLGYRTIGWTEDEFEAWLARRRQPGVRLIASDLDLPPAA